MDSSKTIVEICKEQVKLQAISEKLSKCLEKTKHYGNFIAIESIELNRELKKDDMKVILETQLDSKDIQQNFMTDTESTQKINKQEINLDLIQFNNEMDEEDEDF